jgi:hypothetical protein
MAIGYVGGQVGGRANSSVTSLVTFALTGGLSAMPAAGDLVVVCVTTASQALNPAMAITTPAGYTALGQLNQAGVTGDTSLDVSYKRQGSTPDTTVTLPGSGSNQSGQCWSIQVFRDTDATTPLDVTPVAAGGTGTARPDPGAITPTTTGAWIVICGGGTQPSVGPAIYVAPANYTTNFLTAVGVDTNSAMVGSGYRTWAGGAEDPAAYTGGTTGAQDSWCAYTIALRPTSAVADPQVSQVVVETLSFPTPDPRVSQVVVETLSFPTPDPRVSQVVVETLGSAVVPDVIAAISQLVVETLTGVVADPHVSQLLVETLTETPAPPLRVSQSPLELAAQIAATLTQARLSQAPLETVQQFAAVLVAARLSQAPLEIIYPFGCYVYVPPGCVPGFPIDEAAPVTGCVLEFPTLLGHRK